MLVLTRRTGEMIILTDTRTGDKIEISVSSVSGYGNSSDVRLAVNAPRHITVDRAEVHDRKVLEGSKVLEGTRIPAV